MVHNEIEWKGVEHSHLTRNVEKWWGSYEYGNESSSSIQNMTFLDQLSDCQLLKGSDPHIKLKNINIYNQHHKNRVILPCYEPVQFMDYFPK
jgi:hypothetical protein